ncbi:hypothetical protein NZ45_09885 [Clostridium botulinum]|uniref:Uncharacterized protein n=1 Tax=Clostridium botulinum TaxID=1491 RepID=A0ABD7CM76_CLOBO|nr:hypothetical protein [Clostridium botulinum]KGO13867.1 hypothetical protein NZ45_09885 [Clostridium botulinum]QRI54036.1 hypothetical protein JQS73_02630 [Clostridium botulinum]
MKQAITGYITALINVYVGNEYPQHSLLHFNNNKFIKDLNDLLDYVTDLKEEEEEENKSNKVLNTFYEIVMENKNLNKTVKDLEESCQYMWDIEKNQLEKMELLKAENEDLKARLKKGGN